MIKSAQPLELKAKKGQDVCLIPLGNAFNRKLLIKDQIITDKLISCGNVKASCENVGSFYIDGEWDGYNCGYLPFLSMQDALDHLEGKAFLSEIQRMDLNHLSIDGIRAIKKIITDSEQSEIKVQS